MPSLAFCDYAKVILALPASADAIAKAVGMTPRGVTTLLRRMWSLRLASPNVVVPTGPKAYPMAIWSASEEPAHPRIRVGRALRPRAHLIAFSYAWRCLESGSTVPSMVAETGLSTVTIYSLFREIRPHIRVCEWEPDALGRPVSVWKLGTGSNKRKPQAKTPTQKSVEHRQRKRYRMLGGKAA